MPLVRSRPITIVTRIALSCSESDELTTNSAREASLFPEPVLLSNYGSHRIRSYRRQTMESVAIRRQTMDGSGGNLVRIRSGHRLAAIATPGR
jgi:hypothetical protein